MARVAGRDACFPCASASQRRCGSHCWCGRGATVRRTRRRTAPSVTEQPRRRPSPRCSSRCRGLAHSLGGRLGPGRGMLAAHTSARFMGAVVGIARAGEESQVVGCCFAHRRRRPGLRALPDDAGVPVRASTQPARATLLLYLGEPHGEGPADVRSSAPPGRCSGLRGRSNSAAAGRPLRQSRTPRLDGVWLSHRDGAQVRRDERDFRIA